MVFVLQRFCCHTVDELLHLQSGLCLLFSMHPGFCVFLLCINFCSLSREVYCIEYSDCTGKTICKTGHRSRDGGEGAQVAELHTYIHISRLSNGNANEDYIEASTTFQQAVR
jgi:hypothetical protein